MEEGRGNVFADLGLTNPEERLAKADLAIRIGEAIRARHLTQTRAAHILKIDQPKISRLLRDQLSGFSTERLMHFLTLLGRDVEITVKRTPPGASRRRRQRLTLLHLELVGTVQAQKILRRTFAQTTRSSTPFAPKPLVFSPRRVQRREDFCREHARSTAHSI